MAAKNAAEKVPTVADANSILEQTAAKLDAARAQLSAAELAYAVACTKFDDAVAAARKANSR
jgi:hypothetical protein